MGVVLIDLDGFKQTNDTLGHSAGDSALQGVARRLQASTRTEEDCAARLGGDEFVVVLGHALPVGASIGAAFTPDGACTAETLLADADAATYRAKAGGGDRVVLFDDAARAAARASSSGPGTTGAAPPTGAGPADRRPARRRSPHPLASP